MAAYTALGWLYYSGKWVDRDFQKAFEWYEKGAKAGDPTAMNNISIMYEKGIGVAKDKAKANYWYQKALDSGISQHIRYPVMHPKVLKALPRLIKNIP